MRELLYVAKIIYSYRADLANLYQQQVYTKITLDILYWNEG